MDNKYLLSYLKDYYHNPRMDRVLDYFKIDFDNYLYAYGSQFGVWDNLEVNYQYMYDEGQDKKYKAIKFKNLCLNLYTFVRHRAYLFFIRHFGLINSNEKDVSCKKVLFLDHVSIKTMTEFQKYNIRAISISEYNDKKHFDIKKIFDWYNSLGKLSFKERLELDRYNCLDGFVNSIQNEFKNFDGLFVGNDEYFICKLFIDAFKEMKIPTYNWSHGIEAVVGMGMRTDYKLVWGNQLKDNLVKDGKREDSIIVSGNINYFDVSEITSFRNSLEDVLVLTSVTIGHIRHSWEYDSFEIWDRSLLLTYIYSVEKVLRSVGIKHARLRLHPINNKSWVDKFIDTSFYSLDYLSLEKSLERTTLAIGPTSSTFVEALRKGVVYLIYEPGENGKSITEAPLVSPFDGSDPNIKVAFKEDQLKDLIENKYSYKKNVLDNYMIPFDINSFIHTLGKNN